LVLTESVFVEPVDELPLLLLIILEITKTNRITIKIPTDPKITIFGKLGLITGGLPTGTIVGPEETGGGGILKEAGGGGD
jgi:hypothetical protein